MSPPAEQAGTPAGERPPASRTYVVLHYRGRPLAGAAPPPGYVEVEPLGTVEARTAAEDAKTQAARRWPEVPPRALRTRTARQAGPGPLAVALARGALAKSASAPDDTPG